MKKPAVVRSAPKDRGTIDNLAADGLPDQLFHYTTLVGMQGIVQTGCLWAPNVAFLNDSRELHGIEMCQKAMHAMAKARKFADWHEHLDWMTSLVETVEMPSTYVVCFCERSDLLSQWRGYSGAEQGVTLGFDATKLQERFSSRARLAKVIYGATKTKQVLRTVICAFCEEVGKGPVSEDVKEEFVRFIHRCIPRFKHYGFREEREWRLVVQTSEAPHLKFRPKRTRLVPYFELSSNEKKRLPIKSMRAGPGSDIELTAES
jgi:Protein of unknown function (DUF2971)